MTLVPAARNEVPQETEAPESDSTTNLIAELEGRA